MQNIFEKKAKWGQCGNRTRWRPLADATVSMIWWLDFVSHMDIQKQTSQGNFGCLWRFFSPQGAVISTPLGLKSYLPICRSNIFEVCVPPRQNTKYTHMGKQGSFFQETWKTGPEPSKHHQLCNCVNKIINDSMIKRAPMTLGLFGCIRTCACASLLVASPQLLSGSKRLRPTAMHVWFMATRRTTPRLSCLSN